MCGCTKVQDFDFRAAKATKIEENIKRDDFIPQIESVLGTSVMVSADQLFVRLVVKNKVVLLISKGPGIRDFGSFKAGSIFLPKNYSQIVSQPPMGNIEDEEFDTLMNYLEDNVDADKQEDTKNSIVSNHPDTDPIDTDEELD